MSFLLINTVNGKRILTLNGDFTLELNLTEQGIDVNGVFITCNGRRVSASDPVLEGYVYHVIPRVLGGKGGFGSMLRAIGAQIEKTTNREACRDLSGRRMRDVNNEKQLREWAKDRAKREQEKEERRKERAEKRKRVLINTRHTFDDQEYHEQKMQVLEGLEEALAQGLKKSSATGDEPNSSKENRKRKASSPERDAMKRACDWLGIDVENLSDLSDSDSSSDGSAGEGPSGGAKQSTSRATESDSSAGEGPSGGAIQSTSCATGSDSSVGEGPSGGAKQSTSRATESDSSAGEGPSGGAKQFTSRATEYDSSAGEGPSGEAKQSTSRATESDSPGRPSGVTSSATELNKDHTVAEVVATKQSYTQNTGSSGEDESKSMLTTNNSRDNGHAESNQDETPIDLESIGTQQVLEMLGLERLKHALTVRGLKCGGTLQQRAERLWSVRGKTPDQIPLSLLAKPQKSKK